MISEPPESVLVQACRAIMARRGPEERRLLAHAKRLLERCHADATFAQALIAGEDLDATAARRGIAIDPRAILPLVSPDHAAMADRDERWPIARLWRDFSAERAGLIGGYQAAGDCANINPRFHAWRLRQIRRCTGEVTGAGNISHPILAFELSAGCTMGCWFCGISAERFRGHFPYTAENATLWRAVLAQAVDLFGAAAQTGFCYWATDPCDNPDYPEFIADHHAVTGVIPQTTTAAPTRDIALTRRILALHQTHGSVGNRFSILNLKTLDRVHAAFTPEELLEVEMVLQNREAATPRSVAGRARDKRPASNAAAEQARSVEGTTIACVSGFLVNMVEKTIRLVTPVPSSERWPLGYRTSATARFTDAMSFRSGVAAMIADHMPTAPGGEATLRFRADLRYAALDDGFELIGGHSRIALQGGAAHRLLGDLVSGGTHTPAEVRAQLTGAGSGLFAAAGMVQRLFDHGLLAEAIDAA